MDLLIINNWYLLLWYDIIYYYTYILNLDCLDFYNNDYYFVSHHFYFLIQFLVQCLLIEFDGFVLIWWVKLNDTTPNVITNSFTLSLLLEPFSNWLSCNSFTHDYVILFFCFSSTKRMNRFLSLEKGPTFKVKLETFR